MERTMVNIGTVENYETKLPARAGFIAGVFGSLIIIIVVTGIVMLNGSDIWMAARLIATVVYGPDAMVGAAPIVIGTIIHLTTGGVLGLIFARIVPRLPRGFWMVVGLGYGVIAWALSTFIILPVLAPPMIAAAANVSVLFIAHIIYGFVLGLAGAGYELWWWLPARLRPPAS